jgi:hypothetical protein
MLRYAPLGESCNVSSPRIANPYQSSAYAPVKQASKHELKDACHMFLREEYDLHGASGLFRLMDADMVRDLQAMLMQGPRGSTRDSGFHISIGFEELAVILVGIFLLLVIMD